MWPQFVRVSSSILSQWSLLFSTPSVFFQEGEFQSETIRFGTERMTIDSWVRKRTYDAFREFVGSGMNYHLQVQHNGTCQVSRRELGFSFIASCGMVRLGVEDVYQSDTAHKHSDELWACPLSA